MSKFILSIEPEGKTPIEKSFNELGELPDLIGSFIRGYLTGDNRPLETSFVVEESSTGKSNKAVVSSNALVFVDNISVEVARSLANVF